MKQNFQKISRLALQFYLECPRCFWLAKKYAIRRPPLYPYILNAAADIFLKAGFDEARREGKPHSIFKQNKVKAVPFPDFNKIKEWRDKGIKYYFPKLDALLYGKIDEVVMFPDESLSPIDFKATASLQVQIYKDYQQQMDIYSYLLEKNGYKINKRAYFAFYKVDRDGGFSNKLTFLPELKEVEIDTSWVEEVFKKAVKSLWSENPPLPSKNCEYCQRERRILERKLYLT
ncbi:PD-(D/E)XK nuclease family protein [bacterium]|nr:PD-(D/E)XK nuclease family protein [bacterium]